MKYTTEITINLPRERVIELFDNPDNMKHWQPGLISFEHLSGEAGKPGARSRLKYRMGKREIEMIETITARNLPEEFHGAYEAKGVFNIQKNYFIPVSDTQTKWVSESEFKFSGLMSVMALFMKGAFRKQSMKYLEQFKAFAEGAEAGGH